MLPVPALETERLVLRQWRESDKVPFATLNADPRVMAHFPSLLSQSQSDAMLERLRDLIAERGWGCWALEFKGTGEFIGFTGLHVPSAALPFSPCVEIAWRLGHAHWGKGYATEAARAALRIGFDTLMLDEIVAFTSLGNLRSQAVMQRIGMRSSGTFDHPALPEDSALRQHCLYRLSRSDIAAQAVSTP